MQRGVLAIRAAREGAAAGYHEIHAALSRRVGRAGLQSHQRRPALPLREHAETSLPDTGHAADRGPLEVAGVDHDGIAIARLGVFHPLPVHVLPDRLVAVGVAPALDVVLAPENAILELAELFELVHAGGHLRTRQISAAAGAAEL